MGVVVVVMVVMGVVVMGVVVMMVVDVSNLHFICQIARPTGCISFFVHDSTIHRQ